MNRGKQNKREREKESFLGQDVPVLVAEYSALVRKKNSREHCTRMVEQHTKLSLSSDIISLTSNTEVSNTNSDGLMDTDGSKLDYEYEVIYLYYLL